MFKLFCDWCGNEILTPRGSDDPGSIDLDAMSPGTGNRLRFPASALVELQAGNWVGAAFCKGCKEKLARAFMPKKK